MEYRNPKTLKPHSKSIEIYGEINIDDIRDSIKQYGIMVPLIIKDDGTIISGCRRWTAAIELGLDKVPVEVKIYKDELDEWRSIVDYNLQRDKNFTQKMKEAELREEIVVEEAKRRELSGKDETGKAGGRGKKNPSPKSAQGLLKTDDIVGKQSGIGGKDTYQKAKKIWEKAKTGDKNAKELIAKIDIGEYSINKAYNEVLKEIKRQEIDESRNKIAVIGAALKSTERWYVEVADIHTYATDRHFDFIITDPPYPKEYLLLYEVLAKRTKEWLKSDGLLVVMCGQSYLDQIYNIMSKYLSYYWTSCYLTPGQPTPLKQRQVNTTWKPLLIYSLTGDYNGKLFGDVYTSPKPEKDNYEWEQSVDGMLSIISQICLPGQSIFDPFTGSGSTGVAALMHGCTFHGIDKDERLVNISKGRLSKVK